MKLIKNNSTVNRIKLKDLSCINLGQSPSSDSYTNEENCLPFFQGAADFSEKYTKVRIRTNKPIKMANKNDLLMTVRAPVGRVNFASDDCSIGRGLCSFVFADEKIKEYVYFYLRHLYKNNYWDIDSQGAIFEAVNKDSIQNKEIIIDFTSYGKISKFLSFFEKRIGSIKTLLEKIEIRNQYYIEKLLNGEIFIKHNHNFENMTYQKLKISEIVEKNVTSGTTPKDIKNQETCNYSINYYKVENLNGQLEQKYYINDLEHNNMRRSQLNENDILITIAGTLGRIALVKNSDLPGNINQAIAIIRTDSNKCNNKYVYYFLKTIKDQIERNQNDGAIKNLNLTTLSNIEINLPTSISYQENIVEFLDKLTLEKEKIEKLLSLEEKRFEWLSDKLLSGEYIIED